MDFRQIAMTPEGKKYCTNVKLKADDIALFESLKSIQQ